MVQFTFNVLSRIIQSSAPPNNSIFIELPLLQGQLGTFPIPSVSQQPTAYNNLAITEMWTLQAFIFGEI